MDRIKVDRLVVCGGWQPDLTLWHMAGGRLKWDRHAQQLRSNGKLENVGLAGACAGVSGMSQCARSGAGAFFTLFGLPDDQKAINNSQLAEHESADGALPVSGPDPDLANTYLDAGFSFAMAQQKPKAGLLNKLVPGLKRVAANRSRSNALSLCLRVSFITKPLHTFVRHALGDKPGFFDVSEEALSLNDVVAKVALKEIDAELAEVIAQERCGLTSTLAPETSSGPHVFIAKKHPDAEPPAYLHGRFGNRARTVSLFSDQIDNLEVGSLIYSNTNKTVPGKAIGVIFALADGIKGQALALVDLSELADPHHAIMRNDTHTIEVTLDTGSPLSKGQPDGCGLTDRLEEPSDHQGLPQPPDHKKTR